MNIFWVFKSVSYFERRINFPATTGAVMLFLILTVMPKVRQLKLFKR